MEDENTKPNFDLTRSLVWLQLVATVAVVAGLVLVGWELRESRLLVQSQITQERWSNLSQEAIAIFGDNAADTLARACGDPDNLTDADKVILDRFFINKIYSVNSAKRLLEVAGIDNDWRRILNIQLRAITRYSEGRSWLETFTSADPEITGAIRSQLAQIEIDPCIVGKSKF